MNDMFRDGNGNGQFPMTGTHWGVADKPAPSTGSTTRPDFRDQNAPPDPNAFGRETQERIGAAAARHRGHGIPVQATEYNSRRLASIEADNIALREDNTALHRAIGNIERRLAQLESLSRLQPRPAAKMRHGHDSTPPEAA